MEDLDYLVVGAGLFGAVFAHEAKKRGKKVLVIDKREHIGGNVYSYEKNRIMVHHYGAHIFHTNNTKVWNYVNRFTEFNRFTNSPIANYKGKTYSLPFNMYTFNTRSCGKNRSGATGCRDYGTEESGGAGYFPCWKRDI